MEGIHFVKDFIQQSDWMIKKDLTDAYLTIPIFKEHQKYLQFRWQGRLQFQSLPFGISVAPLVFTKLPESSCKFSEKDRDSSSDLLGRYTINESVKRKLSVRSTNNCEPYRKIGIFNKQKKSVLIPTQEMTFLGFLVN